MQTAIVGALLLISALGEWQLTSRSWHLMRGALVAQALDADAGSAALLASAVEHAAPGGQPFAAERQRFAQQLVEHLDLGGGIYAMVIRRDGIVLAHPAAAYVGSRLRLTTADPSGAAWRGWGADPTTSQRRLVAAAPIPALAAVAYVFEDPAVIADRTQRLSGLFLPLSFSIWAALLIAVWFIVGALVERYESRIATLARTDALTGLGNRHRLDEALAEEAARARAEGRGLAAIAVDLDDFKPINDRFGHATGDRALQALAAALRELAPGRAFRLGGDEFLLLLPNLTEDQAERELERVRRVFPISVAAPDGPPLAVEGSAGSAYLPPGAPRHQLLADADRALYLHKSVRKSPRRRTASAGGALRISHH